MKWMRLTAFFVLIAAASLTFFFVNALKPTSTGAFVFFTAWLVLPYVVTGTAFIVLWRKRIASVHWHVVAVLVSTGGIVFLADTIFWHPDAQGAIAVLMTPILQAGASALLLPAVAWLSRASRA